MSRYIPPDSTLQIKVHKCALDAREHLKQHNSSTSNMGRPATHCGRPHAAAAGAFHGPGDQACREPHAGHHLGAQAGQLQHSGAAVLAQWRAREGGAQVCGAAAGPGGMLTVQSSVPGIRLLLGLRGDAVRPSQGAESLQQQQQTKSWLAAAARHTPCPFCVCCRAKFAEFLSKQPWGDKSNQYFYTREEEYVHGLRCALGIWWVAVCMACLLAVCRRHSATRLDTSVLCCWHMWYPLPAAASMLLPHRPSIHALKLCAPC